MLATIIQGQNGYTAGWDVCLDVIEALLDGRTVASRKDIWQLKYDKYVQAFENLPQV